MFTHKMVPLKSTFVHDFHDFIFQAKFIWRGKKSNCRSKLVIRLFKRSYISYIWTKNKSLFAIDKRHALHAKLDLLWLHFDFVWLYDARKFQHIDSWLMTALYQSNSCTKKKFHHWNSRSNENFFSRIHIVFCNLGQFNNNNLFFSISRKISAETAQIIQKSLLFLILFPSLSLFWWTISL